MAAGSRTTTRTPLVLGVLAAVLYSNFLIDWVLRGFEGMGEVVSELESPGEPNSALLRVTDVVCAVLVVALLPWVRRVLPPGLWRELFVWSTVLFAVGAAAAAIVPEPCGPGIACDAPHQVIESAVHGYASVVSDVALFVGMFAVLIGTRRVGPRWFRMTAWWLLWIGGVISSLLFGYYHEHPDPWWAVGASQRVHILSISVWIFCLGLLASRGSPTHQPEDR